MSSNSVDVPIDMINYTFGVSLDSKCVSFNQRSQLYMLCTTEWKQARYCISKCVWFFLISMHMGMIMYVPTLQMSASSDFVFKIINDVVGII